MGAPHHGYSFTPPFLRCVIATTRCRDMSIAVLAAFASITMLVAFCSVVSRYPTNYGNRRQKWRHFVLSTVGRMYRPLTRNTQCHGFRCVTLTLPHFGGRGQPTGSALWGYDFEELPALWPHTQHWEASRRLLFCRSAGRFIRKITPVSYAGK